MCQKEVRGLSVAVGGSADSSHYVRTEFTHKTHLTLPQEVSFAVRAVTLKFVDRLHHRSPRLGRRHFQSHLNPGFRVQVQVKVLGSNYGRYLLSVSER